MESKSGHGFMITERRTGNLQNFIGFFSEDMSVGYCWSAICHCAATEGTDSTVSQHRSKENVMSDLP